MNLGHHSTSSQEAVGTLFDAWDAETVLSVGITGDTSFEESLNLSFAPYDHLQDPGAGQDFASTVNLEEYQFSPSIQNPMGETFSSS